MHFGAALDPFEHFGQSMADFGYHEGVHRRGFGEV